LPVYRTLPLPWRQHYEVGSSRHKFAYDALLAPAVLARALRRRPHVIHAHMHEGALIGAVVGRMLRIPVVFDFQGSASSEMVDHNFLNPKGPWYRPMVRLERLIDHMPQALVTSTHNAARLLVEGFACDPGHITVVQDRVNARTFRPDVLSPEERRAMRESLGIPGDAKLVVYLGLLAEHQGTSILLRAATRVVAEVPDAYFLIMGYPGVNEYRAYAHSLGLEGRVILTGQLPYDQAPQRLALGDVAVAPKVSATEGAGKLLNYMAMALPTVAFSGPVNREYLSDLGIYPEDVSEEALADTLIHALRNLDAVRPLGQSLRRRAKERFSWEDGAAALEAVYERVLNPEGKRRHLQRGTPQVERG
jgi:glycosyltransferase involved in cell wall biosynthesis